MKRTALISLALATSLLNSTTLPALANPTTSYNQNSYQGVTISQSTAIVVGFPQGLEIDAKQKESQSLTLPLAQPITDSYGNELVSAGSLVSVKIVPEDKKGVYIVAESIIAGGQLIPVKASSSKIASVKIKVKTAKDQARENRAVFGNLGGNVAVALTNTNSESASAATKDATTGAAVGNALGMVTGLLSAEHVYIVRIPQGSVYVLELDAPITLPSTVATAKNSHSSHENFSKPQQRNSYSSQSTPNSAATASNNQTQYSQQQSQPNLQPNQNSNTSTNPSEVDVSTNSAIHRMNEQPISPATMARLRSFLAGNNLAEASCGTSPQQVTIRINNEFVVCGHPNSKYSPGNYSVQLGGL